MFACIITLLIVAVITYTLHAGGDISFHLEKEVRFDVSRVRLYVAELALALEYLKGKSIIHRDLKPANVLLDSEGHAHLTDFNVACIVRPGMSVTSITGTKPYMGKYSLWILYNGKLTNGINVLILPMH